LEAGAPLSLTGALTKRQQELLREFVFAKVKELWEDLTE